MLECWGEGGAVFVCESVCVCVSPMAVCVYIYMSIHYIHISDSETSVKFGRGVAHRNSVDKLPTSR